MNNSSDVIFPILYGSNSTADNTAGQVVRVTASGGTGYTGTFNVTFSHGSWSKPGRRYRRPRRQRQHLRRPVLHRRVRV